MTRQGEGEQWNEGKKSHHPLGPGRACADACVRVDTAVGEPSGRQLSGARTRAGPNQSLDRTATHPLPGAARVARDRRPVWHRRAADLGLHGGRGHGIRANHHHVALPDRLGLALLCVPWGRAGMHPHGAYRRRSCAAGPGPSKLDADASASPGVRTNLSELAWICGGPDLLGERGRSAHRHHGAGAQGLAASARKVRRVRIPAHRPWREVLGVWTVGQCVVGRESRCAR